MKIDQHTRRSIARNILLSIFIYLLPILLMWGTFYITGKRPWAKQSVVEKVNSVAKHLNKRS